MLSWVTMSIRAPLRVSGPHGISVCWRMFVVVRMNGCATAPLHQGRVVASKYRHRARYTAGGTTNHDREAIRAIHRAQHEARSTAATPTPAAHKRANAPCRPVATPFPYWLVLPTGPSNTRTECALTSPSSTCFCAIDSAIRNCIRSNSGLLAMSLHERGARKAQSPLSRLLT